MITALVGAIFFDLLIFISLISKIKKIFYNNTNVSPILSLRLLLLIIVTFGIGALIVAMIANWFMIMFIVRCVIRM